MNKTKNVKEVIELIEAKMKMGFVPSVIEGEPDKSMYHISNNSRWSTLEMQRPSYETAYDEGYSDGYTSCLTYLKQTMENKK